MKYKKLEKLADSEKRLLHDDKSGPKKIVVVCRDYDALVAFDKYGIRHHIEPFMDAGFENSLIQTKNMRSGEEFKKAIKEVFGDDDSFKHLLVYDQDNRLDHYERKAIEIGQKLIEQSSLWSRLRNKGCGLNVASLLAKAIKSEICSGYDFSLDSVFMANSLAREVLIDPEKHRKTIKSIYVANKSWDPEKYFDDFAALLNKRQGKHYSDDDYAVDMPTGLYAAGVATTFIKGFRYPETGKRSALQLIVDSLKLNNDTDQKEQQSEDAEH